MRNWCWKNLWIEKSNQVYELILTAIHGGEPISSGKAHIQVIVLDANASAPVFSQPVYEVSVKENIAKGSTVATVRAIDTDEGINGEVKYSFRKLTQKHLQTFLLNSTTGTITVIGSLDYEELALHEFEVQAEDAGGLSDRAKVVIFVTDLNDNAPKLELTFPAEEVH